MRGIYIQIGIATTPLAYFANRLAPPLVNGLRQLSAYAAPIARLPAALRHTKQATAHIYYGLLHNGERVYVGITNDVVRRAAEHGLRFEVRRITEFLLTRGEARAIEQALIVRNPFFQNIRNSISPSHPWYDDAVAWGEAWLRANGL